MNKAKIKKILNDLHIYSISRNIIKTIYYPYKNYLVKKNVSVILKKIVVVFEEHCSDYWLDYGTLLGYVREGGIIKNDIDLDFGIKIKTTSKQFTKSLEKEGFCLTQQTVVEGDVTVQQYIFENVGFDIFYYREEEGRLKTNIWYADDYSIPQEKSYELGRCSLSELTFDDITTIPVKFYGVDFRIPKDSHHYLEQNYGPDFMTPNPNWTFHDEQNRETVNKGFKVNFYNA